MANERLEGGLVDFSFEDVDRAACVSVETRRSRARPTHLSNLLGREDSNL